MIRIRENASSSQAAEKRKRELEIAEEKYKKWLADKNAVLRRINEEKQEEEKEKEVRPDSHYSSINRLIFMIET